ncbi:MAG: CRISPR-associated helicase Cas3', partial [Spirochaetes bacterium]
MNFEEFFNQATGFEPFPYQLKLAKMEKIPNLIDIPTGAGKTAAIVLGWLYRAFFHPDSKIKESSPLRLIYCLPMRVLVEQCYNQIERWLSNIKDIVGDIGLIKLMGGEIDNDWDIYPERRTIIVGTQDMLISRALNRGYAMSRYRWPVQFALINNDVFWVMDEVQLMGAGVKATTQLQGFREYFKTFGPSLSTWMSATLNPQDINSFDFNIAGSPFALSDDDLSNPTLNKRWKAKKEISYSGIKLEKKYGRELTEMVVKMHEKGTLTLVILNNVKRAQEFYLRLKKEKFKEATPEILLIHSRFRYPDREELVKKIVEPLDKDGAGRILISTQVVEAGVDISAKTLFTEVAPWSSLVQRFGRCNRYGEYEKGTILLLDLNIEKRSAPYDKGDLKKAKEILTELKDVSLQELSSISLKTLNSKEIPKGIYSIPRKKDIVELFDTTPDLSGNDIDISLFIRIIDQPDISVFYREWGKDEEPPATMPAPHPKELLHIPIGEFRDFVKKRNINLWVWDYLDKRGGRWQRVGTNDLYPGRTVMISSNDGGYNSKLGFWPDEKEKVEPLIIEKGILNDSNDLDRYSISKKFVLLKDHLLNVVKEVGLLKYKLSDRLGRFFPWDKVEIAARWHDVGKAHPAFQNGIKGEDKNDSNIYA